MLNAPLSLHLISLFEDGVVGGPMNSPVEGARPTAAAAIASYKRGGRRLYPILDLARSANLRLEAAPATALEYQQPACHQERGCI